MTVFISYSHTDAAFVDKLSARLIEKNIKVWKDQWKTFAGDSFVKKIKDGIEGASYFCIVLSNNSLKSKWVNEELRLALEEESRQNQFTILPILLDECEIPSALIHRIHADFRSSFDAGLKQVRAVVGKRYNIGEAGRIKSESPYYIDYGVEEVLIDGRFFCKSTSYLLTKKSRSVFYPSSSFAAMNTSRPNISGLRRACLLGISFSLPVPMNSKRTLPE